MPDYYDRQGKPIDDLMTWAKMSEDYDYKRVVEDTVGNYWISTCWLGLDHSFWDGPPLIFETMVFYKPHREGWQEIRRQGLQLGTPEYTEAHRNLPPDPLGLDMEMDRYSTEEQAKAGHERMVEKVRLKAGEDRL